MTIRNEKAFLEGFWDWGMLDSCFPGRIKVSDIDGIVQRGNSFLVLETKKPGVLVPKGQEIMFKAMQQKGFTILILWGTQNNPVEMQVYYPNGQISKKKPADVNKFKEIVSWWVLQAENELTKSNLIKKNGA
jgi:hypothetical protein